MILTASRMTPKHVLIFALLGFNTSSCKQHETKPTKAPLTESAHKLNIQWTEENGHWQLAANTAQKKDDSWDLTDFEAQFSPPNPPGSILRIKAKQALLRADLTHLTGRGVILERPEWQLSGEQFSGTESLDNWDIGSVHARFYLNKP